MEVLGSVAAKGLLPLVRSVAPTVRRLRAEREGARAPAAVRTDLMDGALRETLGRLRGRDIDDEWWEGVLKVWEQKYVAPVFFRKPDVSSWLKLPEVEDGFMAIARAHVMGQLANDESAIRARLAEYYSEQTGEAVPFAEVPMDVVVASMTAGYLASIPRDHWSLAGLFQAGQREVVEAVSRLGDRIDRASTVDAGAREALGSILEGELSAILALRMFDFEDAVGRVRALCRRVEQGDLAVAPERARHSACYWATRLLAASAATIADARQKRRALPEAYDKGELRIVDALLKSAEGDGDGAIQMLRDVATPSARSVLIGLLHRSRGPVAALQWFDDVQPTTNPDHFEALGWREWGVCLAKSARWEEAAEGLRALASASGWAPALAMLEGTINAALLLPTERRDLALEGLPTYMGIRPNLDAGAKDRHSRAAECLAYVESNLPSLAGDRVKEGVEAWRRWLELMDPDAKKAAAGRRSVRTRLEEADRGVGLVSLAWTFGIDFDGRAMREELEKREQFGGLADEEVFAECLLNQSTMGSREFAVYVDNRMERLDRVLGESVATVMLFEALLDDGQIERARMVFEDRRESLVEEQRGRMEVALDAAGGGDPRARLEALYAESNDLIDLRNVIGYLKKQGDWKKAEDLVRELFAREPNEESAYEVVEVLSRPPTDHPSVVAFLEANPTIVARSDDMKSALAWGLFHSGRVRESRNINDGLLNARTERNDLSLDVNIAVATGDWERLASIVDREWPRRIEHDAEVLIMLARLVSQGGQSSERAAELARLAAEKSPLNPNVLIAAHGIHVELGRDEDADPQWLARALEHSTEGGPVWAADFEKVVNDWMPRMRERNEDIERKLLDGALPIVLAAGAMNTPVSRILLAERPTGIRDGRRRPLIPILSGTRNRVDLQEDWTVGLDVTSIMVLARFGLLDAALESIGHVKVAPDLMGCLLVERAEARFHQPVRVEAARQARRLLERGRIKVVERSSVPARKLADEVGPDLAVLLEASRENNGVAVCARPIHKVGSLMLETADTSAYDDFIVSPADLCAAARRSGRIDRDQYERAMAFMASQGQGESEGLAQSVLGGPIFVDGLALSYLQSAQVLEPIANSGLDLRVHGRVADEMNAFVEAGEAGDDLAEAVEAIRESLRRGMESGKVSLLPRPPERSEDGLGNVPSVSSIQGLLFGCGACDALCVDDRFINKHPASEDPNGKSVLTVCVLDVLRYLRSGGVIGEGEYWGARHRLREAGFAFVPVEAEELLRHLLDADFEEGRLLESAELRAVRQTVNRFDASGLVTGEEARALSEGLAMACVQVVRTLWADGSISEEVATVLSTWLWRHLPVAAHLLRNESTAAESPTPFEDIVSRRVGMLLLAPVMAEVNRRSGYRAWLERSVLGPLRASSPAVARNAASWAWSLVGALSEHREIVGGAFLQSLPESFQERMMQEDPELARDCGLALRQVLEIPGDARVAVNELVESAIVVFGGAGEVEIAGLGGPDVELTIAGDGPGLRLEWEDADGQGQRVDVPELTLVCGDAAAREQALRRILGQLGPAASGTRALLEHVESRALTAEEVSVVFGEKTAGVAAIQSRLAAGILAGWRVTLGDLVPSSQSYWERCCGPVPTGEDPERYFAEELVPYRRSLVDADVAGGLDICCLGALRDDLSPGAWVEGVDDETVVEALASMAVEGNPIAVLGVLDVALYRMGSEPFREIAENAARTLLDERLGYPDGYDGYRLFEILVDFEMDSMVLVEGAGGCPGFWRRMCAWMQAGLIVRTSVACGALLEVEQLEKWCSERRTPAGSLRRLADCRTEALVLRHNQGFGTLRKEVVFRLGQLMERHSAMGRVVPMAAEIEAELSRIRGESGVVLWSCGPADVHVMPDAEVPDEVGKLVEESWRTDEPTTTLAMLAGISQTFIVGSGERARVLDVVESITDQVGSVEYSVVAVQLRAASVLAAATGDTALAQGVGAAVAAFAGEVRQGSDVESMVHTLMQAAAAHRAEDEWFRWLEDRLADVAGRLPASRSECLAWMFQLTEWMDVALPVRAWFHGRAKRLAVAGLEET